MKIVSLQSVVEKLESAAALSRYKGHSFAGLPERTWRRIRAGHPVSSQTAAHLLIAAKQIDPEITGIEYTADQRERVEVEASTLRNLVEVFESLRSQVATLQSQVAALTTRRFRDRVALERHLPPPPMFTIRRDRN